MDNRRSNRRKRTPWHLMDYHHSVPNDGQMSDLSDVDDNTDEDDHHDDTQDDMDISSSSSSEENDSDSEASHGDQDPSIMPVQMPRLVLHRVQVPVPANAGASTSTARAAPTGPAASDYVLCPRNDATYWDKTKNPYCGPNPGQKTQLPPTAKPIDVFDLFVSPQFLRHIVSHTNKYAKQRWKSYNEKQKKQKMQKQKSKYCIRNTVNLDFMSNLRNILRSRFSRNIL